MLIHLMHCVVMWLNNFPVSNGISSTYTAPKIVLCHRFDYNHHCWAPFRAYCKTHEDNTPTNNMTTRGCPAICLELMGNIQGTYNFLNLVAGLVIKCCRFDKLPIPDAVITRVEHLAGKLGVSHNLVFANHNCIPFNWPEKAFEELDDTPMAIYPDIPANILGVQLDRGPTQQQHSAPTPDMDWLQMADNAMINADLKESYILSPASEVIVIDDDADTPLPPALKHKSTSTKVKLDPIVPPISTPPAT